MSRRSHLWRGAALWVLVEGAALGVHVPAGGNLQTAIDNAQPGETITLEPGQIYSTTTAFKLRSKTAPPECPPPCYLTIKTAGAEELVPNGARVTPNAAVRFAKIVSKLHGVSAIKTEEGAHGYRLIGLEIYACAAPLPFAERCSEGQGLESTTALIDLGPTAISDLNDRAYDLLLDRLYIHGDPARGARRGIALNSRRTQVVNSYISDFKTTNVANDAQAINGVHGTERVTIENNYLEASSNNVMFGGGNPLIGSDLAIPTNIRILRNHFTKPLRWMQGHPHYEGTKWAIKTLFELKYAKNVLIEGNIFENNWVQGDQDGYAIVLTVKNQINDEDVVIEHVRFIHNIVRHAGAGIQILGRDRTGDRDLGTVRNIDIINNVFYDLNEDKWGAFDAAGNKTQSAAGFGLLLKNGPSSVRVNHNTFIQARGQNGTTDGGQSPVYFGRTGGDTPNPPVRDLPTLKLAITNNILHHGAKGISGDFPDTTTPTPLITLTTYAPGHIFQKNLIRGTSGADHPNFNGNFFSQMGFAGVGFALSKEGDYRLKPESPYNDAASDGKDLGANLEMIFSKTLGVTENGYPYFNLVGDKDDFMLVNPEIDTVDLDKQSPAVKRLVTHLETRPGQQTHAALDEGGANRPVGFTHFFYLPPGALITEATVVLRAKGTDPATDVIGFDISRISPTEGMVPIAPLRNLIGSVPQPNVDYNIPINFGHVPLFDTDAAAKFGEWPAQPQRHGNLLRNLRTGFLGMIVHDDMQVDFSHLRLTLTFVFAPEGDLNGDLKVDRRDIALICRAKGTRSYGGTDPRDLNGDGHINDADAQIIGGHCP